MMNAGAGRSSAPRTFADVIGFSAAMRMVRRRWPMMILLSLAAAVTTFAVLMLQPPSYTAVSLLIVTPSQGASGAATSASSAIDSEIELLRSPALMADLAQALSLRSGQGDNTPAEEVVRGLAHALSISRRGDTNVVEIAARSTNPQHAQQIANIYADVYLANQLRAYLETPQHADTRLARRLAELGDNVLAKESAAEAFRVQAGLPTEDDAPLPDQQIDDQQGQVALAQADLDERLARSRGLQGLISSGAPIDEIAAAVDSETLNGLRDRLTDINGRQADLEDRYLPSHPAVIAIRSERANVEAEIQQEIERASASLASQVSASRARLQALQQSSSNTTRQQIEDPAAAAHHRDLLNEAAAARLEYETYLRRNAENTAIDQLNIPDSRLLAYATIPGSPSSPRLQPALALAGLIGLLLALGSGLLAELLDRSVKNADDLDRKVGSDAIASIPSISGRMMRQMPRAERHPSGYLAGRPMSAFAEALRLLRTVIIYSKSKFDTPVKVVAITSALPNEGKTTISVCLARIAAMSGQRVCVVDCDLRMQSISDVIDITAETGLLQVLAGELPWSSAIVRDPKSEADILPVAASGFTPRDVFGSDAMARLIGELRTHYDLVILDCPPILAVAETRILVKQADTTVVVARAGRTPLRALRAAISQTTIAGGNVLGVALNCVLPHWQTYSDSLYFDQSKSYYTAS